MTSNHQPLTQRPAWAGLRAHQQKVGGVADTVIFNFHGYPWLIHKLAYRFRNRENFHVRGYKERGNINRPLELAILNQTDRFDRVPGLAYAHEHVTDRDEITNWVWSM